MHRTQNTAIKADQPSHRWDRASETDVDRRFFGLRDGGYLGPIDQDGHPALTFNTDVVPVDNAATALRRAARYLSRHGWTQGAFFDLNGRMTPPACIGGAIAIISYGCTIEVPGRQSEYLPNIEDQLAVQRYCEAIDYLDEYLIARHGHGSFSFNDVRGRTATQVIVTLLNAADAYDTTHGGAA